MPYFPFCEDKDKTHFLVIQLKSTLFMQKTSCVVNHYAEGDAGESGFGG